MLFRKFDFIQAMIILFVSGALSSCRQESDLIHWNAPFPAIGTQSSPRCTDLNKDGVLDIVIGAGMNEYYPCEQAVLALDGKNGKLLWSVSASDQVIGSPTFLDITQDGTDDVIIGGRSHTLMAIDGKNGKIIWQYKIIRDGGIKELARFNFFNCQLIQDSNGDGLNDLLVACGGNAKANPNTLQGRLPGTMMILESKTGQMIAIDTMPDGLENYMSPVILNVQETSYVLFGTGGETFGGNLYKVNLADLVHNNLKNSKLLVHNPDQGFIAPPTLADINHDGMLDIIVPAHNGTVYCIDGHSDTIRWKMEIGLEANNMLAPGYFNEDDTLDFFGFFTAGAWPDNNGIVEFVLDGRNGNRVFKDSIGSTGFSSPISFQADSDLQSEIVMHINFGKPNTLNYDANRSQLIFYDFPGGHRKGLDTLQHFKNISTTPWLGDLDGDNTLELITVYLLNTYKIHEVNGMYISVKSTDWKGNRSGEWREYMGKEGKAIFRP
jgi:outer membrane protein assembly factor BamB